MYYTYIIRCKDNSLYTGITTDIKRRMEEHKLQGDKCAKYTINHPFLKLECVWESENRAMASKLEYHIKTLNKKQKEKLILEKNLEKFLKDKIESSNYKVVRYDK